MLRTVWWKNQLLLDKKRTPSTTLALPHMNNCFRFCCWRTVLWWCSCCWTRRIPFHNTYNTAHEQLFQILLLADSVVVKQLLLDKERTPSTTLAIQHMNNCFRFCCWRTVWWLNSCCWKRRGPPPQHLHCSTWTPLSGSAVGGQCGGKTAAVGQGEDPLNNTGNTAHEQLLRVC